MGRKVPLTESELRRLNATVEQPPRRGGRGILLALVLAVGLSVILAGVWYSYWRPSGATTPEDAFLGMIDAFNREDAEEVVSHTTANFAEEDERDFEVASMKMFLESEGPITLTVNSWTVIDRDMMGATALFELDETVQWVEEKYEVDVKDSCAIEFTITSVHGVDSYTSDSAVPVVMVGQCWYVAAMPFTT